MPKVGQWGMGAPPLRFGSRGALWGRVEVHTEGSHRADRTAVVPLNGELRTGSTIGVIIPMGFSGSLPSAKRYSGPGI